jgi:capsular exopolysaccharide synthesis family protein
VLVAGAVAPEVSVVAGVGTNNISVVDPAEVPLVPHKPNLRKNLLIALFLGLMGGIGLALLFEHLDDTVKSASDLEKLIQRPVLGIVPRVRRPDQELPGGVSSVPMLAHLAPKSAIAEAFRSLRTALQFSTAEGAPKLLHYTSSAPGEGKTTSAIATAITYAQTGATVLLIDADLRNPSVHKEFRLQNTLGLTNCLTGKAKPVDVTQDTEVEGLFCITAGPSSPNPVELLSSGNMVDLLQLATERFDYVVVDGPPVLGLADALVLGAMAHATILVVEAGETRKGAVEAAVRRLMHVQVNLIGGILTKYERGGASYGYDYDYYGYHYYGYGTELPDAGDAKGRLAAGNA